MHPVGELLAEWSQLGCLTKTGRPLSKEEMWEAVACGPHQSSLSPKALAHFVKESVAKVKAGQAKLVLWEDIKDNLPPQLKILPIVAIPHKSKTFCLILDLSFRLRLKNRGFLDLVNNATVKMAPRGALNQLGHALSCIPRLMTTTKSLWQSGISRMASGRWIARLAKNSTLLTSSHRRKANQPCL